MRLASLQRPLSRLLVPALAACLFAIVVGLKWAVFDSFGSPMPDWDQWDAEGEHLLAPWFENDAFWSHLFHPHNEHRVVLTKTQNLALTVLNGQWDARLQAVTNALLHATLAAALWACAVRWLDERAASSPDSVPAASVSRFRFPVFSAALWILAIGLFGLPIAWQNVLGGFHSQQYWLVGLSCAAIVVWPFAPPWSARWWLGAFAGTLALLTMASGFIAAVVVLGVVAWRALRRTIAWRQAWPTLAWCAALIAVGLLTRTEVAYHAKLKATSLAEFSLSLLRSLAWPLRDHDWVGALMWTPWAILTWRVLRGREHRGGLTLAALGGWVVVQLLATAYARGAGADYPASRYMDTLTFGAMLNAIALAWISTTIVSRGAHLALATLAAAWLGALGLGVHTLLDDNFGWEMPEAKRYYWQAETHLLGFLATNDIKQIEFPDIPYPDAPSLARHLRHQSLRALMPAPVRPSLTVKPADGASAAFIENRASALEGARAPRHGLTSLTPPLFSRPTWGTSGPDGPRATGEWRSAPVRAKLGGWLKFEIAGDLGAAPGADLSLSLQDAASGRELAQIRPDKRPGDTWRAAYVRAPEEPFVIVARDASPTQWLAFSAPVEVASLSHAVWRVSKHGLLLAEISGGCALALFAAGVLSRPRASLAMP